MSFYKYLKIQEVIKDLNTLSYKILRLPRWINGKKKKNPPAKQEMQVWSLGWEDPLGKEMATPSREVTKHRTGLSLVAQSHSTAHNQKNLIKLGIQKWPLWN